MLCGSAQASEPLQIGAEDDWRPYSYVENGKPVGFAVDIVRAAWKAAGVDVELISLPYTRCMKEVDANKIAGCFDTLRDPKLETLYRWHSSPLFNARIAIYGQASKARTDVIRLGNLYGQRIGVTRGYDYGAAFDKDKKFIRDEAPSDLSSLRKLAAGRIDYALVYDKVAEQIFAAHPELKKALIMRGVLVEPSIYISFAKEPKALDRYIALFDQGLEKIRQSGEYARIELRWKQK